MDGSRNIEIHARPEDIPGKYTESRMTEKKLLGRLERLLKSTYETQKSGRLMGKVREIDPKKDFLDSLEAEYNDWQTYTGSSREGLNSGPNGELFMRLIGVGILEDLPELVESKAEDENLRGLTIISAPQNKNEKGLIEATIKVRHSEDGIFYRFRFNVSVSDVGKRIETLNKEIEEGQSAYDQTL